MYDSFLRLLACETLCYLPFPIAFGLYAFDVVGEKVQPSYDCYATKESKIAFTSESLGNHSSDATNVSEQFHLVLLVGFGLTLAQVVIIMPAKYCLGKRFYKKDENVLAAEQNRGKLRFSGRQLMTSIVGFSYLALTAMIFVLRGSHAGFVCSGAYLSDGELREIRNR